MRTPARTLPRTACRPHVLLFNDMNMRNSFTLGGGERVVGCGVCGQTSPHLRCCHAWLPGCHPSHACATLPSSRLLPPWPKLPPPGCYPAPASATLPQPPGCCYPALAAATWLLLATLPTRLLLNIPRPSCFLAAAATLPQLLPPGCCYPAAATRLLPPGCPALH
jgi:hypothetical protein